MRSPLATGQTRKYRLSILDRIAIENNVVRSSAEDGVLSVKVGEKSVLNYNLSVQQPPSGIASFYRRSGYIHPLFNPIGQPVTGDFAPDHAHQHGLFMAWVSSELEGRPVDFWNQAKQQGDIKHVSLEEVIDGPVFAQLKVKLRYVDHTAPVFPVEVMEEDWTVRIFNTLSHHLFDIRSEQKRLGSPPLKIKEYHYGGLALRGSDQWLDPNARQTNQSIQTADDPDQKFRKVNFLTDQGKNWFDGNHTRARWVDMAGTIDGVKSGVAVMSHPENFRSPQKVRLHPQHPYFCFTPMVDGEFEIGEGDIYTSRYRFFVHMGAPDSETIDRKWNDYVKSPSVRVIEQ